MNLYDMMQAAALAGGAGGGGIDNLMTSTIEQGAIDSETGANVDNTIRLRTRDSIALGAGDYALFFTADGPMYVRGMRYAADGAFIECMASQEWTSPPLTFTATEGQKFRFTFTVSEYSTAEMQPTDLHNLILVAK